MSALQRLQEFRYKKSQATTTAGGATKTDLSTTPTAPSPGRKTSPGLTWPSTPNNFPHNEELAALPHQLAQTSQTSLATKVYGRHDLGSGGANVRAEADSPRITVRLEQEECRHYSTSSSSTSTKQSIEPLTPFKQLVGSFRYTGENGAQAGSKSDNSFGQSVQKLEQTSSGFESSDGQDEHATIATGQKRAARRLVKRYIVSSDDDDPGSGSGSGQKNSGTLPTVEKRRRLVRKSELVDSDGQSTLSKASSPVDRSDSDTGDMTNMDESLAQLQSTFPDTPFAELKKVLLEVGGEYSAAARNIVYKTSSSLFSLESSSNGAKHHASTGSNAEPLDDNNDASVSNGVRLQRLSLRKSTESEPKVGKKEVISIDSDDAEDPFDESHQSEDDQQDLEEEATLQFFNDAPSQNLIELAGCSKAQAALIIGLRPFSDNDDLYQRLRGTKGVSARIVDTYQTTKDAIQTVDKMLTKVEHIRRDIVGVLSHWRKMDIEGFPELPPSIGGQNEEDADFQLTSQDEVSRKKAEREAMGQFIDTQPSVMADTFKLKSYQLLGMNWLALLWRKKLSGILADEMGLGKTAQVIAFLAHLYENNEKGPFLVIVPSSTISNWLREFSKFCPTLDVRSYYGLAQEREELRYELSEDTSYNVVVTTYNIATGNNDERKFLSRRGFKGVILDEGHMLKNCTSLRYKQLMNIKSDFRLLLTGTPLQNNLEELLSLIVFVMPGLFGDHEDVLRTMFKIKPDARTESSSLLSKERITRARHLISPFVLRRKKALVLKDLPPKTERVVFCELNDRQKALYDRITSSSAFQQGMVEPDDSNASESTSKSKNAAKSGTNRSKAASGQQPPEEDEGFANVLMQLRKIAVHPMLCRDMYNQATITKIANTLVNEPEFYDSRVDYIVEDMMIMSDFEIHRMCKKYKRLHRFALTGDPWMDAGKVKELNTILPPMIADGYSRVLIFSQFTMALDVLEVVMETMGLKFLRLDGQTKVEERQPIIDEFNDDQSYKAFLLSTKAGGFGINLTGANTVIMYDLDFNPHNDKQAEDRVHRVGQTREVQVIKLVTKSTVEEQILELANMKLKLDEHISKAHSEVVPQSKQTANSLNSGFLKLVKQSWKTNH
ncbi:hypothetical protein BGW38_000312 [Lunasporangiospora selenospora]|uniref:DNA helicase n=1 Tax=Lunasporangiospora selenospora TaxID=979761 RepID=A0A9P6KEX7_9FUNG|nr:hypothetical protein BGW38_000312 [Lunasporangiospora selenospora]